VTDPVVPTDGGLVLVPLRAPALEALLREDLHAASQAAGARLSPWLLDEGWLWRVRLDQAAADPAVLDWTARAALDPSLDPSLDPGLDPSLDPGLDRGAGVVVGHVGFHGPPDERGMVEVGYSVDPAWRRRGYGTRLVRAALAWAATSPGVRVVRASISPENAASLATLRPFGFAHVGEQVDEEDGLELLFEREVGQPVGGAAAAG
jgi:RimJ/RimL family protein N-acetyltransferase